MNQTDVTFVRIYCTEAEHKLDKILSLLHDEARVSGVTAFRGIAGFGKSGKLHSASLVDMSLDLPVVIEFFDHPDKVASVFEQLKALVESDHVVSWPAKANLD